MKHLAPALKRLRASQPLNGFLTGGARILLRSLGIRSERVIRHLHRMGSVRCRLPNGSMLRLWSRGDDWVSNQIYWRGWSGYEPETAALFFRLAGRARVTIDVGAYVGYYTLLAAHANPKARVFAFEPLPAVFRRLESNVGRNRLSNVTCLPFAVGSKEELREFYHVPVELPTSSSLSFEFMKTAPSLAVSRVRVIVLDRFVTERGVEAVDLVKIDTESTEPDVLRGMGEILARHRPTIVCEVLAHRGAETSLEELLGPLGYNFYLLTPAGPALRDHVEGHPEWLNYLFTPLPPEAVSRL